MRPQRRDRAVWRCQSRDSYAKQTEKKSDYERWDADRYWDYWAKQDNTKPGNVT